MLLAVVVELADFDFGNIMFSGICPYPFGIYLVLLRNLFGCIIFGYIDIILWLDAFIRFSSSMSLLRMSDILELSRDARSLSSFTSL